MGVGEASGAAATSDAVLDQVASALQRIARGSGWERTLAIGRLILRHFFDDDVQAWRARGRGKSQSIRRLAERPDCPFGKSALTQAVGVYVFHNRHPEARCSDRITPTHLAKVVGLAPERAIDLLRTADQKSWSVARLGVAAATARWMTGERRRARQAEPESAAGRWARHALDAMAAARKDLFGGPPLGEADRRRIEACCAAIEEELRATRALLADVDAAVG